MLEVAGRIGVCRSAGKTAEQTIIKGNKTMRRSVLTVFFAAIAAFAAACQPEPNKPTPNTAPSPAVPASPDPSSPAAVPSVSPGATVDPKAPATKIAALEGVWPGVEGTSLTVAKTGDKYKVSITGLDKKIESFEGVAKGDTIEFKRKDKVETIKAATAEETGMKWLQGEKNCVVITKGSEGYCKK